MKIKVDKLGDDKRYSLMKETTQLLVDASTLWTGYVAGSLPHGFPRKVSVGGTPTTHTSPSISARFPVKTPNTTGVAARCPLRLALRLPYKTLWLNAQVAMAEVLGKAPTGSYAAAMAKGRNPPAAP